MSNTRMLVRVAAPIAIVVVVLLGWRLWGFWSDQQVDAQPPPPVVSGPVDVDPGLVVDGSTPVAPPTDEEVPSPQVEDEDTPAAPTAQTDGWGSTEHVDSAELLGPDAGTMSVLADPSGVKLTVDDMREANRVAGEFVRRVWTFDSQAETPRQGLIDALELATPDLNEDLAAKVADPHMSIGYWPTERELDVAYISYIGYVSPGDTERMDHDHYVAIVSYDVMKSSDATGGLEIAHGPARFAEVELERSGDTWVVTGVPGAEANALIT